MRSHEVTEGVRQAFKQVAEIETASETVSVASAKNSASETSIASETANKKH